MAPNEAAGVASTTDIDLDQIDVARALLLSNKELPSQEQIENQEKLFGSFGQLILGPSCKVRIFGNNGTLYGYESLSGEEHLLLVRVGSHGLGTWKPSDPMSCVCFGSMSKSSFLSLAENRLQSVKEDEKITIHKKSTDPENEVNEMFHVSLKESRIGLHFCFLAPYGMSRWDDLLNSSSHESTLSTDTMRALNACKDIRYIHDSIPNIEKFKIAYHFLHLWARYRGIYSERLGYLSHEQILLLLNYLWKTQRCDREPLPSILNMFFTHYSQLDWDKEVIVDPEHGTKDIASRSHRRTPVIICSLFSPWRNTGSLITRNSLQLILREFARAANLTGDAKTDWQELLGLQALPAEKDPFSFAASQFIGKFSVFVRFEMRYWGSNAASRVHFLNSMENKIAFLFNKLTESEFKYSLSRSRSLAFAWPYRLRDRPESAEAEKFFYLIGVEYNGTPEDLDHVKNSIRSECDKLVEEMCQLGMFDPTTGWVNISIVGSGDIEEVFSDGDGVPGEPEKIFMPRSVESPHLTKNVKKVTANHSAGNEPPAKLRPAADILSRLIWDPEFDRKDYIVGYDDRFSGALEVPLDSWKSDPTDDEFIPQHRILYFKHRSSNEIVSIEEDKLTRELTRGAPTDSSGTRAASGRNPSQEEAVRKRSQYFEDSLSTREPHNTPKYRVNQDSIVIVEMKTNTRVTADEFQLLSDISSLFMQVYQRPENSILVTVEQNACLRFGSSPAPAYLLTVSALPSLIAPVTNLRNTILIQQGLKGILRIPPNRGVIRFTPVPEENFATNGATIMGEIDHLEQTARDESPGILKSISRSMSRKLKSSSTNSNPLSLSLTNTAGSSIPLITEVPEPSISAGTTTETVQGNTGSEGGNKERTVKKSGSVQRFVARRLSELGSIGDTP
ncbi:endonuclease/exonuclease/phosphatase family protein [Paecilomyces variotii No. 5]|uniref:Endonuclease/exonuclease/phosphatase family protein n=1 Tax=Byssochlamys spectabilis (strain No. 5 / NBRC 109023) TaxID=1356009 RepID=V5FSS6_BYSSN|nr:endonuclease/exonuclease/phosphatase family protein [Paecilomyces variotii No. 5]